MNYSNMPLQDLENLAKQCKAEAAKYQSIAAKCQREIKRRKRLANKQLENHHGLPVIEGYSILNG